MAIIAFLIIIIIITSAKSVRAHRIMTDIEIRYGIHESVIAAIPRSAPLRQMSTADLLRPRTFIQYQKEIDDLIVRAQALEEFGDSTQLSEACSKALGGGKRIRAVVLLEIARTASIRAQTTSPVDAGEAALFIEYIHAASLAIDDLPMFDNDQLRRGRASLHEEMGCATAQMAAVALISAALQNICRQVDWLHANCPEINNVDRIGMRLCALASRTLGVFGASGGQLLEMSPEDWTSGHGIVERVAVMKTASLFELAVGMGWLVAGGDPGDLEQMTLLGRHFGLAFQIADDIGDMAQDAARATPVRPDCNYANRFGRNIAHLDLERHLRGAELVLRRERMWSPLWEGELFPAVRAMCCPPGPAAAPHPPASAADPCPPASAADPPDSAAHKLSSD